jgi:hypothetical protein
MRRLLAFIGLAILLFMFVYVGFAFAQVKPPLPPAKPSQACCIAGTYEVFHSSVASKTCPKPDKGKTSIMEIKQGAGCDSKIWGKVTDAKAAGPGGSQEFTGAVTPDPGECCNINGVTKKSGEETQYKGILCMKGGTWAGKGTYTSEHDQKICHGTWEMKKK